MCKVMEDMRNEALKEGMKEGIKEGMKEGMRAAALRMMKTGRYTPDEIADISGLSLEEVTRLSGDSPV